MKLKNTILLGCFSLLASTAANGSTPEKKSWVSQAIEHAHKQIGLEIDTIEASGKCLNPVTLTTKGEVYNCGYADWRSGFFPGSVWYLYELTGDQSLLPLAQKYTEAIQKAQHLTWHHDIGFIINCSFGNGLRIMQKSGYKEVMVQAAKSLCTRFREKPGVIQSWDVKGNSWQSQRGWECPVIIDNMMNLELLFEATKLTGDSTYYKVAVAHADRTLREQFRNDGSCYHVIDYSITDGSVRHRQTAQGYADESAWARGQAWAIYGYTVCYRETRDKRYLDQAIKTFNFMKNHKRMPADLIPYWDMDAPKIPNEPRDASSASVIASALYEMSTYPVKEAKSFKVYADRIMKSLATPAYTAPIGKNGRFLLMHSVGSIPHNSEIDVPLNYADYYYLEALQRKINLETKPQAPNTDRQQWAELCYRIAAPVLENMSKGELQKNMQMEYSPTWDGRDKRVAYMETFGRLMAGISPWLALSDDATSEGKMRKQLREWAILSYKNAVDPSSPDFLLWKSNSSQRLVDAAYLAESFLRAPQATWKLLDPTTQKRYIERFKDLRNIRPAYNNWLLFRATIEAFLMSIGEEADQYALTVAVNKMNEWYLSDGWYSDGPEFSLDYYNSFVMHPMYIETLEVLKQRRFGTPISPELAIKRMQRFNVFMERLISPEGTFPAFGRSVVYRMGAFQTLAMAAWKYGLPAGMSNGQVRSALTAVMQNMFKVEGNFNEGGFLQLGFAGHQPGLSNYYTNNGSLYMTSLVFMPLGLPANHPFWSAPAEPWSSQKAWSGKAFPIDGHHSLKTE